MSQIRWGNECPIQPQVWLQFLPIVSLFIDICLQICQICENECIGFDVTNTGRDPLVIEKASQAVACLSVWATVKMEGNMGDRGDSRY